MKYNVSVVVIITEISQVIVLNGCYRMRALWCALDLIFSGQEVITGFCQLGNEPLSSLKTSNTCPAESFSTFFKVDLASCC